MSFFKPDDFYPHVIPNTSFLEPIEFRTTLAELCNAKLEREGLLLKFLLTNSFYGQQIHDVTSPGIGTTKPQTHKALLINIEPIEKCTHPEEKVKLHNPSGSIQDLGKIFGYICECGAKLRPKTYEEI